MECATTTQVEALLRAWLDDHRIDTDPSTHGELAPFERDTLTVLRQVSQGRPGILLNRANELFHAGAEAQKGLIDVTFAREYFAGAGHSTASPTIEEDEPASNVVDLLA